jgi:hypothetical protein
MSKVVPRLLLFSAEADLLQVDNTVGEGLLLVGCSGSCSRLSLYIFFRP